jgi:hypothetical protein
MSPHLPGVKDMAKKTKKKRPAAKGQSPASSAREVADDGPSRKMKTKEYEREKSQTGSKSDQTNRPGDSRAESMTHARSGSSPPWT